MASSSEDMGAPGARVPFSVNPILLDLEGRGYMGLLLPGPLVDLVSGRRGCGGISWS